MAVRLGQSLRAGPAPVAILEPLSILSQDPTLDRDLGMLSIFCF